MKNQQPPDHKAPFIPSQIEIAKGKAVIKSDNMRRKRQTPHVPKPRVEEKIVELMLGSDRYLIEGQQ